MTGSAPFQERDRRDVLRVNDLTVSRPDEGWRISLPDLHLAQGDAAALLGPSGCGKTSLLLGMLGLRAPPRWHVTGDVALGGKPWPRADPAAARALLRSAVCVVLQDAHAALDPLARIGEQLAAAAGAAPATCTAALEELGVLEAQALCRRFPHEVSGGQAQRVLLAVALLRAPSLLVLDEPSASLDGGSLDDLLDNLSLLRGRTGTAVLLATHDHRLVDALAARGFTARNGSFTEGRPEPPPWPRVAESGPERGPVVLACRGLALAYGRRRVFAGVDLELRAGESVALVGESGAGKTSLARVLVGLRDPDAGTVQRPAPATAVQLLFQDALGSLTPGRTVRSLLRETAGGGFDPASAAADLGLPVDCLDRTRENLSGGERRRAALLRALSVSPRVLVLDEPSAALDRDAAVAVARTLLRVQAQRGVALLWITHDLDLARAVSHRILKMKEGRLCSSPS